MRATSSRNAWKGIALSAADKLTCYEELVAEKLATRAAGRRDAVKMAATKARNREHEKSRRLIADLTEAIETITVPGERGAVKMAASKTRSREVKDWRRLIAGVNLAHRCLPECFAPIKESLQRIAREAARRETALKVWWGVLYFTPGFLDLP